MATRKNTTNRSEAAPVQYEILRVNQYKRTTFFDIKINGVAIYGCTIVDGKDGSFIGWPSHKAKGGKFYKYVYVQLTEDELQGIIDAVDSFKG